MSYQPKRILVTGGAGFIGCHFVQYMLKHDADCHIVNLDALTYAGNKDHLPNDPRHHFVHGDICDGDLVKKLLRDHQIDTLVHFAAESHVDRSITGPAAFVQTNVVGTFQLLDAARQVWLQENQWNESQCRFHHISTDEVYGTLEKTDPAFTELTRYEPNSPYSSSKAGSDHLVRAYYHTYGLPVTTSNCSNNYGPQQHPEKLIPTVMRACFERQPIPIYGDGSNIRDWLYVVDHCEAINVILNHGKLGEVYNIGGNNELTNLQVVKHICDLMDARLQPDVSTHELLSFVKDRPGHDWRYAIDASKIQHALGWTPLTDFKPGLANTLDFYHTAFA